ncbi:MAG: mechanosensitive ion channel [Alphaproteobacteria bacterium]|nr:mechanosensitive ion channel [Alphaproteobacteria bacterium]
MKTILDFLNQEFYNNSIKSYMIFWIILLLLYVFKRNISRFISSLVFNFLFRNKELIKKKEFYKRTLLPIEYLLLIITIIISLRFYNYPSLLNFHILTLHFSIILNSVYIGSVISILLFFLLRIIDYFAFVINEQKAENIKYSDASLISFLKSISKVILIIIWFLLILKFCFNQNIGNLLTGLSILGASIALATRESIENIIASIVILVDKPFRVGDYLEFQDINGTVLKIGLRSTKIRADNKEFLIVPNKRLVDFLVKNISKSTHFRPEIKLHLDIPEKLNDVEKLLDLLKSIKFSDFIESQRFYLKKIENNYLEIYGYYYVSYHLGWDAYYDIQQIVNLKIVEMVNSCNLKFSVPKIQNNIK